MLKLAITATFVVGLSSVAFAQRPADVVCKSTETQPECHARLHCKADEELEDCQKRLLHCQKGEALDACVKRQQNAQSGGNGNNNDGNNTGANNGGNDRGGDRGDDRGDDRGNDRGRDRGDDRGDDRSDRGRDRGRDDEDRGRRRGSDRGERRGRRRGGGGGGGGSFESNKTFGLGVELGEPTGLTGKVWVGPRTAIDFGVGYIYRYYYYGDGLHVYGDFLFHPVSLAHADAFELPFYIGAGLRFWNFDYDYQGNRYTGTDIGIRIPVGLSFDFNNAPIDIFFQLVPTINFVNRDYYDRYRRDYLSIDGSVGFRFYFK